MKHDIYNASRSCGKLPASKVPMTNMKGLLNVYGPGGISGDAVRPGAHYVVETMVGGALDDNTLTSRVVALVL